MTARAALFSQRRGACPGLSAPMPTGDGLLVRFLPAGTISLDAFVALCGAAGHHGNGIIEVTARGSIQVRGLTPASAPRFADAIAALDIAASDGVPVHVNPLAGLDPTEILDAGALAAEVRRTLAGASLAARLAPKVSVVVDGGGTIPLEGLSADVRLRAERVNKTALLYLSVAGNRACGNELGAIAANDSVVAITRLLEVVARHGRDVRARDIVAAESLRPFRAAIADLLVADTRCSAPGKGLDAIGTHHLRDGRLACGIGLPFGHADTAVLQQLTEQAKIAGVTGLQAAPERTLIFLGLSDETASGFISEAERRGFVTRADDPRRHVIACAGAPICASGHIAARTLAPVIAEIAAPNAGCRIHVSGCTKGCAHAGPAALTVVGTPDGCALIAAGSVHDAPFASVAAKDLAAAITRYASEGRHV